MAANEEEIVMTPSKKGKATRIKIERKRRKELDPTQIAHEAGGQHKGLVVGKDIGEDKDDASPQLQLEFKCWLEDAKSGMHIPEGRLIKFWFVDTASYLDRVTTAYEFFRDLVQPHDFPRDYVGFIKKCMKLMQNPMYSQARKVDIELKPLDEEEAPMSPGGEFLVEVGQGLQKVDKRSDEEIAREKVLTTLETAYPNVLSVDDIVQMTSVDTGLVSMVLDELKTKSLIVQMDQGSWMRQVHKDAKTEVKVVKQMPIIQRAQQPTIAIITSNYYEKIAVDSMMEEKTTFMRYKGTGGESNVYTLGYIGEHRVVSTKLPMIGHSRAAKISTGNTTTRLLGTFAQVDHVMLVGCGGGVPHFTDFYKHCRLGDVVISTPNQKGYMYIYCDKVVQDKDNQVQYTLKSWSPHDLLLQRISEQMKEQFEANPDVRPWDVCIEEGLQLLGTQEQDFSRPPASSDKLFMNVGGSDVIEVGHPPAPENDKLYKADAPDHSFWHHRVRAPGRCQRLFTPGLCVPS
ncbi:uncharacterized protein LOC106174272 isoform X2 [Lingula anatina]|uniref:Uncharacterized protein LOC106174272 isoform X2 n=1 Tax=Lingula anatina TaxID=7574 RepID=A0A1S3JLJ4_LINAN|nr:uncharacterized protein LOC106174272 isoform X2 [Lingula anatina]|eukprot:XP_013411242.1 uncharacterized protein LOC106174272 isoform X2 [Lingula anatina]